MCECVGCGVGGGGATTPRALRHGAACAGLDEAQCVLFFALRLWSRTWKKERGGRVGNFTHPRTPRTRTHTRAPHAHDDDDDHRRAQAAPRAKAMELMPTFPSLHSKKGFDPKKGRTLKQAGSPT